MEDINREFIIASRIGNIDGVKTLLERGVNIDIQNDYGENALTWASVNDNLDVVKMLLEKGANIDIQDNNEFTALMMASLNGHLDVVKTLLEKGANIDIQDKNGRPFMDHVSEKDKDEIQQIVDRVSGINIKG